MGLFHRIPRQLRANLLRYLSLFFLIALCMYVVVGLVGAADTIIKTVADGSDRNLCEDGQFTVFAPLSQEQLDLLTQNGAVVEAMFYLDFPQADGSVIRIFQNRESINLVQTDAGGQPTMDDHLLLEKLYADAHENAVGDSMMIGGRQFTVSGVGSSPDYDSPFQNLTDMASDKQRFGTAFVTKQAYDLLRDSEKSIQSETYLYAYRLNGETTHEALKEILKGFHVDRDAVNDPYVLQRIDEVDAEKNVLLDSVADLVAGGVSLGEALDTLGASGKELVAAFSALNLPPHMTFALEQYSGGVAEASAGANKLLEALCAFEDETTTLADEVYGYEIDNLTSFLKAENNPRIAASAADVAINRSGGILAGIIGLALFGYVISVFVVHSIDSDSEVIGTLYALGVPHGALLRHYLAIPAVIALLGGVCGTVLGFSPVGVVYLMRETTSYFSFPSPDAYYPVYLLVYGMAMPVLVTVIVNWLVIRRRLAKPPHVLLKKEPAKATTGGMRIRNMGFIGLFRLRQILREKRTSMTVCIGMFIALLLLFLGVNSYSFIAEMQTQNDADVQYEYMVSLKYPPKEAPRNATAVYMHSLSKEAYGTELDICIMGINEKNPYFDFTPAQGEEVLTISNSMANKYRLQAGDTVILTDGIADKRYVFTIDAVIPYSAGLYAFMDIESARSLFGAEEDAYNLLLSDTMPEVDAGRIYSITTKADILEYSDIFMELMMPMIVMMIGVATVVFVIVMYLMMKMMIDRSSFGISLLKVFGFSDGEVRKLYLDGNFITVTLGAVMGIPLAKIAIDALYPIMISNVALGPDMTLQPWLYAAIVALVYASYFFISLLLNRKIKRVTAAVVLKQRE